MDRLDTWEERSDGRATVHRRRTADGQLLGVLLLAFGVGCLLRQTGVLPMSWKTLFASLLIILGFGLVITARRGRRRWPILLGIVLILGMASSSSTLDINFPAQAIGDRVVRPIGVATLERTYRQGIGNLTIDLSQTGLMDKTTTLTIHQGVGNLDVVVPEGVGVETDVHIGIGHADVLGRRIADGAGVSQHHRTPDFATAEHRVSLQVHLGVGNVEVKRSGA